MVDTTPKTIRIGTRGSRLALWQANHVADLLREKYADIQIQIVTYTTKGDKLLDQAIPSIGGKGIFTAELEHALLNGEIDCAVHSLKDLPTDNPDGLTIGAITKRGVVEDVLISKHNKTLDELPIGAKIGTSSLRRAAQLRSYRSDFEIVDIRGNVPTRINKALDPSLDYDAIVLARVGFERLEMTDHITQVIPLETILPAPGQGAIAVQCRTTVDDISFFWAINDMPTRSQVVAERGFLNRLEGGCAVPVATYAKPTLELIGKVVSLDGQQSILVEGNWDVPLIRAVDMLSFQSGIDKQAKEHGFILADRALKQGAKEILEQVKNEPQS